VSFDGSMLSNTGQRESSPARLAARLARLTKTQFVLTRQPVKHLRLSDYFYALS